MYTFAVLDKDCYETTISCESKESVEQETHRNEWRWRDRRSRWNGSVSPTSTESRLLARMTNRHRGDKLCQDSGLLLNVFARIRQGDLASFPQHRDRLEPAPSLSLVHVHSLHAS
jgi:hypothetical protein